MENTKKQRPFGVLDQIGYVAGDMAGSFVNLTFDAFYLVFATYVLGVDPTFMSTLFLFARLFDAINDPLIGSLPDRFRIGRSGDKFKPYIKIFMWPLALSILMGFFDITSLGVTATVKHIWVAVAYILYGVSYTGTSMPFGAMAAVVSKNPDDRAKLSAARAIGGTAVGYGFLGLVPLLIWDAQGNPSTSGYQIMAIIAAVLSIVCYLILCKFTIERHSNDPVNLHHGQYKFFDVVKQALTNRAMLGIMFASIGSLIYITGNSQFGSFVFKEFYRAPQVQTVQMYAQLPLTVLLFLLVPRLAHRFGKRKVLTAAVLWNLVTAIGLFLFPIADVYVYVVLYTLSNIGQSFFIMLVWAFVAEAVDYNEYLHHTRADGTLYSIYTFSRKIGSTIASFGATALLAAIGFVSGAAAQTPEVASAVRAIGTGIPVIACALEFIGLQFIYPLTQKKANEMNAELAKRGQAHGQKD